MFGLMETLPENQIIEKTRREDMCIGQHREVTYWRMIGDKVT